VKHPYVRLLISASLVLCLLAVATAADNTEWPAERDVRGLTAIPHSATLDQSAFAGWTVQWSPGLRMPAIAYGKPVSPVSSDPRQLLAMVTQAANSQAAFELQRSVHAARLTRYYFRELRTGLPVLAGRADIVLNSRGQVMRWGVRAHDSWPTHDGHYLGMTAASAALSAPLKVAKWHVDDSRSFAAWFPDYDTRTLRPVYWIRIAGERPDERWEGIVDAVSGEVILNWPGIRTDVLAGTVQGPYWQPFLQSEEQIGPNPFELVNVNTNSLYTDSTGAFSIEAGNNAALIARLTGPFVDVQNDDGPNGQLNVNLSAPYAPLTWTWSDTDATHPELNLFHHVNLIHGWYKVLDPGFTALDYPVPAIGDYGDYYDNAFWDGYEICFGSGNQYLNFAMFSDVIYHEYTHGVTDGIYPNGTLPYDGESGAMNEAWSDYFAATINGDPYMAEWIGGTFNSYFRSLLSTIVYPDNWHGEVHADSPFISAPLWTLRTQLGAETADSLAHYARYALAETFEDFLQAVLETDDDDGDLSNGTPHSSAIYAAFGAHGIGPGDMPLLAIHNIHYCADGTNGSVGDSDRFVERGERAAFMFNVSDEAAAPTPPATDIQISVHTDDSTITVENGTQTMDVLSSGQSLPVNPILLQVSPTAADHWCVIQMDITSNGGAVTLHNEFEFTIGTIRMLIVEDDPATNVEGYVTRALRRSSKIFDSVEVASGQSLSSDLLPEHGLVVWLSGNAQGTILTASDQALLQDYVTAGNHVLLSGQNIVDALQGTAFAHDFLHVDIANTSIHNFTVNATQAPFTPNEWFLLIGATGAGNQTDETSFTPLEGSQTIAYYDEGGTGPTAAVSFADGKGLLLGFGIEAISGLGTGSTNLAGFFNQISAWESDSLEFTPAQQSANMPATWSIGPAYPNPFNGTAVISYSIPSPLGGELAIYDLMGREVERRHLAPGAGTTEWSPQVAAGMYFARLSWNGGQTKPVKLLYLK
jgi:hypothetical protein